MSNISPLRNYAINLDNLENVEGFNEDGKKDVLYGYQLDDRGIYVRTEIPSSILENGEYKHNTPLTFIYEAEKWISIPAKYEWDIDIKLKSSTLSRKDKIMTITNSGKIIGSLISLPASGSISSAGLLLEDKNQYCIASHENKEAHLEFKTEHKSHADIIMNPPIGSTIIIEGRTRGKIRKNEILIGLQIATTDKSIFDFKIILMKEENNKYGIRFVTPGIKLTQVENTAIGLNLVKIHDFYYICRIRLTTQPVSENEIKYL